MPSFTLEMTEECGGSETETIESTDLESAGNAARNAYARSFEEIREYLPDHATASEWVQLDTLNRVHKVNYRVLRNMIFDGILEDRPTDGQGREVRIVDRSLIVS